MLVSIHFNVDPPILPIRGTVQSCTHVIRSMKSAHTLYVKLTWLIIGLQRELTSTCKEHVSFLHRSVVYNQFLTAYKFAEASTVAYK